MFSDDITSSGKFLRMSLTAQALYLHLGINADDDGIVEAYAIMRLCGAKEDDLVILSEREFVTILDTNELVLWITGWQDFNKIKPNLKSDSKYLPLLRAKVEGIEIVKSTKEEDSKRRYAQLREQRKVLSLQSKNNDPSRIMFGAFQEHTSDPTIREGKERLGKDKETSNYVVETPTEELETPDIQEMKALWKLHAETTLRNHVPENLKAYRYLLKELGDSLPEYIQAVRMLRADQYQKRSLQAKLINYVGLREKLENVEAYMQSKVDHRQTTSIPEIF